MRFSLFYFADDADHAAPDRYRLLLEGARFADTHGFEAVWTPERHYHPFGGRYPNPAVTGAAIATVTDRVAIRAGSVVPPLHHALTLVEEWSVVDHLAGGGRVGLSLASGGSPQDFVVHPEAYPDRRERTVAAVDELRRLWRGESYVDSTTGRAYRVYPSPPSPELPLWLTCAGSPETYEAAGRMGTGVLTHLMNQSLGDLAERITAYRRAYETAGWPGTGRVTLMLHTYLDRDRDVAEERVREPLQRYLMSAMALFRGGDVDVARARLAVRAAYRRYVGSDGLIGTVDDAAATVKRCRDAGVDEIACLVDFGVPTEEALGGLTALDDLRAAEEE